MSKPYGDHPIAALFPLLEKPELESLATDMKANGQLAPITLYEGKILDGRNRYRACSFAEIEPKFREFSGKDPLAFIISVNLHRRHLSISQRSLIAAKIAKAGAGGSKKQRSQKGTMTNTEAATAMGVSEHSVDRAKSVLDSASSSDIKAIEQGDKSIGKVEAEIKKAKTEATEPTDKTGHKIPEPLFAEWDRAAEFSSQLHRLSQLKCEVEKAIEEHDPIFLEITNTTTGHLHNAYSTLERVIPYSVCPKCLGRDSLKRCGVGGFCHGRGFVSKYQWGHLTDAEKKMWMKAGEH